MALDNHLFSIILLFEKNSFGKYQMETIICIKNKKQDLSLQIWPNCERSKGYRSCELSFVNFSTYSSFESSNIESYMHLIFFRINALTKYILFNISKYYLLCLAYSKFDSNHLLLSVSSLFLSKDSHGMWKIKSANVFEIFQI